MREARRVEEPVIEGGASNFSRAQVPWAFDLAAAWSWRMLVVAAAVFGALWLLSFFAVVVLPLLVAMFASALLTPVVHLLMRIGAGRRIASLVVVIFSIVVLGLLLTFVGQQIANGMDDLSKQVSRRTSSRCATGCAPVRSSSATRTCRTPSRTCRTRSPAATAGPAS